MPSCTRCHSLTCNGGGACYSGACKTCGSYSCHGNCSVPGRSKPPPFLLRCAVCGETYSILHPSSMCQQNVERMKRR